MMPIRTRGTRDAQLVRAHRCSRLTANIVNSTIGAGIFVLPALMAHRLGRGRAARLHRSAPSRWRCSSPASPSPAAASRLPAVFMPMSKSRSAVTSDFSPVLYCTDRDPARRRRRECFRRLGGRIVPLLGRPIARIVLIAVVYGTLAVINIRGVRDRRRRGHDRDDRETVAASSLRWRRNFLHSSRRTLGWPVWPGSKALGDTVLLLMFAFFGIEVALIPSGEVKNPARTVPRAFISRSRHDRALHPDPTRRAGNARRRLWRTSRTRRWPKQPKFSRQHRPHHSARRRDHFRFRFCHERYPQFAAHAFRLRARRGFAGWFAHVHPRFRTPDVAIIVYAAASRSPCRSRHVRTSRRAFERRRVAPLSALLRGRVGI